MAELFPSPETNEKAYRVLARKYRPSTFSELIGQEAMVRTLGNAILANRLPQAWMLTGVRGIGKTTTARLIARALNCVGPRAEGVVEPCGVCEVCRAIAEDRHVDVLEMDAASRTGVDDIREVIDGVRYGPVAARYKIYILDEVHMLSKPAFNALLKTLEEPPPHTKFIFATTEIRKVPVTVLSRCQRFDLRRIDAATLTAHFSSIAQKENIAADEEAIRLIARAADGSVRDGLSLLDQAIARGNGAVTADDVKDMLGLASLDNSLAIGAKVLRGEVKEALDDYARALLAGAEPLLLLQDLSGLVHLLSRAQIIPNLAETAEVSEAERRLMTSLADLKIPALTRAWQILMKGLSEVQTATNPAQAAEMVLIRLAYAASLPPPGELIKKIQNDGGRGGEGFSGGGIPSGDGGARAVLLGGTVARLAPVAVSQAQEQVAVEPLSFREVVALFEDNREAALLATLRAEVRPVRCLAGVLEINVAPTVAPDFVSRVAHCLTTWTGQRWMVSVTNAVGGRTLAEEDREAEAARMEKINNHPLMKECLLLFPKAKIVSIKQKEVALTAIESDEIFTDELNDNEE